VKNVLSDGRLLLTECRCDSFARRRTKAFVGVKMEIRFSKGKSDVLTLRIEKLILIL
jgi:hypothetical protein